MKIPFFNLEGKVKIDEEDTRRAIDELFNLIKLSEDNGKEIKNILVSRSVYWELKSNPIYPSKGNSIFGYKLIRIPDIAVVWKK